MIKKNSDCRICGSKQLTKFLTLGLQPLANDFLSKRELKQKEKFYPLDVYFCHQCSLVQLIDVVSKEELFRDYVYFTSGMPKISDHFRNYAEEVMKKFLKKNDLVVEIGSNDGVLLDFFKKKGYQILGIDPAENIAKVANQRGVLTWPEFFNEEIAKKITKEIGQAKAILANNVVAHINDHHDLAKGVKILLDKSGVFIFEAPYLIDMFENLTYDTIYHEHLSYLAVRPLMVLFKKFGLEIFDVQVISVHGQSLRVFVGHRGCHRCQARVKQLIKKELAYGLNKLNSYRQLAKRIAKSKQQLVTKLKSLKVQGRRLAAYGAPAKGNTLLNYAKIGVDILDFALEDLSSKQGFYTPGMHIPVVDRQYAEDRLPDYYLLLAWNYLKPILTKEKDKFCRVGKFIIPVGDKIQII